MQKKEGVVIPNPVRIELYSGGTSDKPAATWQALEQRLGNPYLTNSWNWVDTWRNTFGDVVPHYFAIGLVNNEPQGVALITQGLGRKRGPFTIRTLHFGTTGEQTIDDIYTEPNRLLVATPIRDEFSQALVAVAQKEFSWDELHLDRFEPEDAYPLLAANGRFRQEEHISPIFDFRVAREEQKDILGSLGNSTRSNIRRSLKAYGNVNSELATTLLQAQDIFAELIKMHQASWRTKGEPGKFSSELFTKFHQELISRMFPKGKILLFRASTNEGTIGCLYSFVDSKGQVLFYQGGLDMPSLEQGNKYHPGLVSHALQMQQLLEMGFQEYNFLPPDDDYKKRLSNCQKKLISGTAQRGAKMPVIGALTRLKYLLTRS